MNGKVLEFAVGAALLAGVSKAGAQQPPNCDFGTVRFVETTETKGMHDVPDGTKIVEITKSWAQDGFSVETHKGAGQPTASEVDTPQGFYSIIVPAPGVRQIDFGTKPVLLDNDPFLSVADGKSVPLGILPPAFVPIGSDGLVNNNGSHFKARWGAGKLLTRLERLNPDGSVRSAYTFEGRISNEGGGYLPRVATYQFKSGSIAYHRSFEFQAGSLGVVPSLSKYLDDWNQPGSQTTDHRLVPPMVWTYKDLTQWNGGNPRVTPDRLLELSRQRAKALALAQLQLNKEHPGNQGNRSVVVWIAGALVALFALSYLVPYLLRRQKAARQ